MALTIPPNAQVIVPDCAFLVKSFLTSEACVLLGPAIVNETFPRWVNQMTLSKGWPARVDKGHQMARFGDEGVTYTYKDKSKPMFPVTPALDVVRTEVARVLGWRPNCIVINSYAPCSGLYPHRDGSYIPQLGVNPIIAAVSFGASRTFKLHPTDPADSNKRAKGAASVDVVISEGDLLVMHGECDTKYHHSIPEEPEVIGTRISLTFRKHMF